MRYFDIIFAHPHLTSSLSAMTDSMFRFAWVNVATDTGEDDEKRGDREEEPASVVCDERS